MATVAELQRSDGFVVASPDAGVLGVVEETWLDGPDHPGALAIRTPEGHRALVLAGNVLAIDPDAREVFVTAGTTPLDLDVPRAEEPDGRPVWKVALFALAVLATLICAEIAADFAIAYVVTGNPPY